MAWKMIGKPKVQKATRELVERFAKMTPAPGDRPVQHKRAARMRHLFATGQFRTCEWASALCVEDGQTYRVNGKHTSTMLFAMNGEAPSDLFVVLEEYECDSLDDVARLYATFDSRDSVRTTRDINRSFSGSHEDLRNLPVRVVDVAVSAIAYEEHEDAYSSVRAEDRAAKLLQHGDFAVWLNAVLHGEDYAKHLARLPVVAAIFRTWKRHQAAAEEFWTLVRDGSGPNHHSPDRKLHKYLLTTSVGTGRGSRSGKEMAGRREMYVKSLHAWNAWREKKPTDLKYYPAKDAPRAV